MRKLKSHSCNRNHELLYTSSADLENEGLCYESYPYDLPVNPSDLKKIAVYNKINNQNPDLFYKEPDLYFRINKIISLDSCFSSRFDFSENESCLDQVLDRILSGLTIPPLSGLTSRIKSYSLSEFIRKNLKEHYLKGYDALSPLEKKARDRDAFAFIRNWCKDFTKMEIIKLYHTYWLTKKGQKSLT